MDSFRDIGRKLGRKVGRNIGRTLGREVDRQAGRQNRWIFIHPGSYENSSDNPSAVHP